MPADAPPPLLTAHLFGPLDRQLVELLGRSPAEAWARPTVAGAWQVRDVVAHLIDGALRRLSYHRDGMTPPAPGQPIDGYDTLVRHLNALNAGWVDAFRRLSPAVLRDLLRRSAEELAAFVVTLDPEGPALFPVAWAGEDASRCWFDIARDYTERWHHQAQIRDALGAPLPLDQALGGPVIAASMLALPHRYRLVDAPEGTVVAVAVTGEAGGAWTLARAAGGWRLATGPAEAPAARIETDADTAWRVFFNACPPERAAARVRREGPDALTAPFLTTRAVMV